MALRFIKTNNGIYPRLANDNQFYWFNKTLRSNEVFYQCKNKKNGCPRKITSQESD